MCKEIASYSTSPQQNNAGLNLDGEISDELLMMLPPVSDNEVAKESENLIQSDHLASSDNFNSNLNTPPNSMVVSEFDRVVTNTSLSEIQLDDLIQTDGDLSRNRDLSGLNIFVGGIEKSPPDTSKTTRNRRGQHGSFNQAIFYNQIIFWGAIVVGLLAFVVGIFALMTLSTEQIYFIFFVIVAVIVLKIRDHFNV